MKRLLLIPLLASTLALPVSAQTLKISHKSHAGMAATFCPDALDHFGLFKPYYLQDSTLPGDTRTQAQTEHDASQNQQTLQTPPAQVEPVKEQPQEEVAPQEDATPSTPASPANGKKARRSRKAAATDGATLMEVEDASADVASSKPQLTAHQAASQRRVEWMYGLMGLTLVPTLVLASGAFSRRQDKSAS